MPSRDKFLADYAQREAQTVLKHAGRFEKLGYLESAKDFFPDANTPKHLGFANSAVPLGMLALLYEQTVVYVPPLSRDQLATRLGMPFSQFVELAEASILKPVIGQVEDYGAEHFVRMLESVRPPALWPRGVAFLGRLGLTDTLVEAECPLPIADMASLPTLTKKYKRIFPGLQKAELHGRIKLELLTEYADLWVFGEGKLADSLPAYSNPQAIADRLHLANEVRTYPILFGMGGTANYEARALREDAEAATTIGELKLEAGHRVIPSNLSHLLEGVGLSAPDLDAKTIIEFHKSGSGIRLQNALRSFEQQAIALRSEEEFWIEEKEPATLLDAASDLEEVIQEATATLKSPDFNLKAKSTEAKAKAVSKSIVTLGLPALGFWLTSLVTTNPLGPLAGGGAAWKVLKEVVEEPVQNKVIDAAMVARFNPGLANMWRIQKSSEGPKK